jgi:hypothetical protein
MITLIAAAALAAQPAAVAPAAPQAQHEMHMQMGQDTDHKGMDCCKECCKDMDAKHGSEHSEHGAHQQ